MNLLKFTSYFSHVPKFKQPLKDFFLEMLFNRLLVLVSAVLLSANLLPGQNEALTDSLLKKGNVLSEQGEFDKAIEFYWAKTDEGQQSGNPILAGEALMRIGFLLQNHQNKLDSAILVYEQAKSVFKKGRNLDKLVAKSFYQIASAHHLKYDYPTALSNYQESIHIYENLGDEKAKAAVLTDLATFHRDCGNLNDAKQTAFQALGIHEKLADSTFIWYDLFNLAIFSDESGQYDEALKFYRRSLDFSETDRSLTLNNMANTYKNKGDLQQALSFGRDALETALTNRETDNLPIIYSTLCETNVKLGNFDEAMIYGKSHLKIAQESGDWEMLKIACFNLSTVLEAKGRPEEAFRLFKDYIAARDSITNENKNRDITRQLVSFEFEKREALAAVELERQKTIRNALLGGVGLMLLLVGLVYRNFRQEQRNKKIIQAEKQKSDDLLLNILPATAAEELKTKGSADARLFPEVTVLFSDFKDFTLVSERISPDELVKLIHFYFSEFDRIVERLGIEKIKTIGDAYVCANGLNTNETDRPHAIVQAALDMHEFTLRARLEREAAGLPFFECRIGINTGPVVAGVVGIKKFTYDIWGDTVNLAARMEQNGVPGKTNISEATFERVRDGFHCEFRGKIEAKNKGEVRMYFVHAARP